VALLFLELTDVADGYNGNWRLCLTGHENASGKGGDVPLKMTGQSSSLSGDTHDHNQFENISF
jgi:hypothetical protein